MPLIEASGLTLSTADAAMPAGVPLIGWHNLVTFGGITATSEDLNFPASNMANEATILEWRAASASPQGAEVITVTFNSATIDYVGIARHNFGTAGITVTIVNPVPSPDATLVQATLITTDEPLIFQFTPAALGQIEIRLSAGSEAARAAVVYVGKLLYCERGVDIGSEFAIPRFARKTETVSARSARGDYLGSVVLSRYTAGMDVVFKHFTPSWYRSTFDPFLLVAQSHHPFFWQWSPEGYPAETAFVWLPEDPVPLTSPITGRVAVSLKLDGIIE